MITLNIAPDKKVFFASDQHFGAPTKEASVLREQRFLQWLQQIEPEAGALFLLGDLFDFWFEYSTVVPKGFVRILGKLGQMRDQGLPVFFFVGNHDLWMKDYFENELNIPVFHAPELVDINGTSMLVGHGDGLGPGDNGYKRMKKIFVHPLSKWLFKWLHPDVGVRLAQYLSVKNKLISGVEDTRFLGEDQEWLVQYAKRKAKTLDCSYYIFGHRHLPMQIKIGTKATYFNLGDWIQYFTFGVFDPFKAHFQLNTFTKDCLSEVFHPISNCDGANTTKAPQTNQQSDQ